MNLLKKRKVKKQLIHNMKILISLLCFFIVPFIYGQKVDTINILNRYPVRYGYVINHDITNISSRYINPINGVEIFSKSITADSVFSLSKGQIISISKNGDGIICIIKSSNLTFTYANLDVCKLKKGMYINKGNYIGKMRKTEEGINSLELMILKNKKTLDFKKHIDLINAYN